MAASRATFVLLCSITCVHSRTFLDDLGVPHTFDRAAARVAAEGHVAISLLHFGMQPQQGHLSAVWGGVAGRGSENMEEIMQGTPWSHHDPLPGEVNSITGNWFADGMIQNLSDCFGPWNCRNVDWTLLPQNTDFVIIYGTLPFSLDADLNQTIIDRVGRPPIFLSRQYEDTTSTGCSHSNGARNCFQRSTIDIVSRFDDLAAFLGYEDANAVASDRNRMCQATQTFTAAAKRVQDLGMVTAMAAIYPLGTHTTAFLFNPILDASQMLTFEQLGLPILYPGKCGAECGWTNSYTPVESLISYKQFNCTPQISCNDSPFYKIDFWFLEGGSLRNFVSNQAWLEANFPDKALLAGQYHQSNYGYGYLSYRGIAIQLEEAAADLNQATRRYAEARSPCVHADPTELDHIHGNSSTGGLPPGEVICYNEAYHKQAYKTCASTGTTQGNSGEGMSGEAIAGIAVACAVVGICAGFAIAVCIRGRRSEEGQKLPATPYGKAEV